MHYPSYTFSQSPNANQFFFTSSGKNGLIRKVVVFTSTGVENIYNLGFGDYDETANEVDDLAVSDNNDTAEILATVYKIIDLYLQQHSDHQIIFTGNTPSRNRLYRIAINKELHTITESYFLLGFRQDNWEKFEPIHDYELFLISKK